MAGERRDGARVVLTGALRSFDQGAGQQNRISFSRPSPTSFAKPSGSSPFVKIGGQWYRQADNGRADVLVPTTDPWTSPAELAARRAGIERSLYMAGNTLAGVGYSVATLAGASPQTRDKAMLAGGAVNTVMTAGAPLGARTRAPAQPPAARPPLRVMPKDPIRYGQANASGQASYASATVTKPMLRTGEKPKKGLVLPGLGPATPDRSHLIAKVLGGKAKSVEEAVALSMRANRGRMNSFEKAVKSRVAAGEVVEYFVEPLYRAKGEAPSSVILTAHGSRGGFTPRVVQNSGGRGR